jgi:hypothetical protein
VASAATYARVASTGVSPSHLRPQLPASMPGERDESARSATSLLLVLNSSGSTGGLGLTPNSGRLRVPLWLHLRAARPVSEME